MSKKYAVGIVPGSFDPITKGHVDIVRRAAELCDEVVVAVMINSSKQYMFTIEQRERIAQRALLELDGVKVISSDGMLWMLARDLGAEAIIKGVRNETDRAYELEMAKYNEEHYPPAKTVLLEADSALVDISSTLARKRMDDLDGLDDVLPKGAIDEIKNILKRG